MPLYVDRTYLRDDVATPAALSLPVWPPVPEAVDRTGTSFVIVDLGGDDTAAGVADAWAQQAEEVGPVTRHRADRLDVDELSAVLARTRCGVRVMIAGPQDDVLLALATARAAGAEPDELMSFATRTDLLAVFCAHCRATSRVAAEPGGTVSCPACGRMLEIHSHVSAVRGSFLGSDATARELV